MARITDAERAVLPASAFGLPDQRKYPIDTRRRAANAKGRARTQWELYNLTTAQYRQIVRRANLVLYGRPTRRKG